MIYGDKLTKINNQNIITPLSPDPLVIGQANNLYNYTLNNLINYLDLDGKFIFTLTAAAVWGGVKLFAGGAAVGATVNVATQVGSDMIGGFHNIWFIMEWWNWCCLWWWSTNA